MSYDYYSFGAIHVRETTLCVLIKSKYGFTSLEHYFVWFYIRKRREVTVNAYKSLVSAAKMLHVDDIYVYIYSNWEQVMSAHSWHFVFKQVTKLTVVLLSMFMTPLKMYLQISAVVSVWKNKWLLLNS